MKYFSNTTNENKGCLIIAEIGINHNGDINLAKKLVKEAKKAGADAVKFQTWITEENTSRTAPKARHQKKTSDDNESQYDLIKKWELDLHQHQDIMKWANKEGIVFFSKPGSPGGLEILRQLNMPMIKIGSPDLTNLPLIKITADLGLPMILSTGMGTLGEIEEAIEIIYKTGNDRLMLMHCTSSYPTLPEQVNLRAIKTLQRAFALPIGFSDHSEGIEMAIAAIAMNAVAIEKHFTIDRGLPGADHKSSMEPGPFAEMVRCIRSLEKGLGDGMKKPHPSEKDSINNLRRSLVIAENVRAGTVLTPKLVGVKRPGTGIPPKYFDWAIGKKVTRDMQVDQVLTFKDIVSQ